MNAKPFVLVLSLLLSGCALKNYPASPPVSNVQSTQLDCSGVQQLIAEQAKVQQKIDLTSRFNGLSLLGMMLDLGIGNGVAGMRAQKAATLRQQQLQQLAQEKCHPLPDRFIR